MEQTSVHNVQLAKLLAAAAAGATVMYLLDPERGAPRRARSQARLRAIGRHTGDALVKAVAALGAAMGHAGPAAKIAHGEASTADGTKAGGLDDAVNTIGVARGLRSGRRNGLFGGGALSLIGLLGSRSPITFALGLAGLALMSRSAIARPTPAGQGDTKHRRLMTVDRSIRINADPEQVYAMFANYDNFPRYMANVLSVRDLGQGRSHWVIQGPAGSQLSWNSVLTENNPPRRLAWESEPGSEIAQSGEVLLEPVRSGTRVTVRLRYRPPAGALGQALASLLGSDPGRQLEQDLVRMKALLEHGSTAGVSSAATNAESAMLH